MNSGANASSARSWTCHVELASLRDAEVDLRIANGPSIRPQPKPHKNSCPRARRDLSCGVPDAHTEPKLYRVMRAPREALHGKPVAIVTCGKIVHMALRRCRHLKIEHRTV